MVKKKIELNLQIKFYRLPLYNIKQNIGINFGKTKVLQIRFTSDLIKTAVNG